MELQFKAQILSSPGATNYSLAENRRKLELSSAAYFRDGIQSLVRKLYQEWGADPVGFGQLFRTRFPTFDAWMAYDWPEQVQNLDVQVATDVYIRRFGLILDSRKELER